ncbi:MAG: hypothetical protein AAB925_01435, partial [Patescibacteria group bacterium]
MKCFVCPPLETVIANALSIQILDSAACNLDRKQDSPITICILAKKICQMQVHEEMQRAESPRARAKAQAQRTYLTLA